MAHQERIITDDGELLIESPVEQAFPLAELDLKPKKGITARWQPEPIFSDPIFILTVSACMFDIWGISVIKPLFPAPGNAVELISFMLVVPLNGIAGFLFSALRRK